MVPGTADLLVSDRLCFCGSLLSYCSRWSGPTGKDVWQVSTKALSNKLKSSCSGVSVSINTGEGRSSVATLEGYIDCCNTE